MPLIRFNPITIKRFNRFRAQKRAWCSFLCLLAMNVVSLGAELWCNGVPLWVSHEGRWYFPFLRFYPEDQFLHNGVQTQTNYRSLASTPDFTTGNSWMFWPLLPYGPNEIVSAAELHPSLRIQARLTPEPQVAAATVNAEMVLQRFQGAEGVLGQNAPDWKGRPITELWQIPPELSLAIKMRLANQEAPRVECACPGLNGMPEVTTSLPAYQPRARAARQIRLTLRRTGNLGKTYAWQFASKEDGRLPADFLKLPDSARQSVLTAVAACRSTDAPQTQALELDGVRYQMAVEREAVRYPFRPVQGHWLGIDDAGRDVLVRLLYALRTSLTFGLILVCCSLGVGTLAGFIQGYCGGWVDLTGQRMIEIWSALPFLYVIILLGSIYGPGFWLMLFCYALFNWIGMSHYMRAQMLQLRKQPFVEAALCLGLPPWRIVLRHILPNSLVPLITFFPFSLVGAIGSLAMLDYLGFGLPPPTPSIGQLLQQAQAQRWAWWLILYPSLLLFWVMLLGVFVGEGVRDAFDPRQQGRLE